MSKRDDYSQFSRIRNVGIIAHIDAGKTTITERFLFHSGKTHRIGDIDSGNTVMDYLDEERRRGITIVAAAASFPWHDNLIHLIDTPGHIDFTVEVERSIRVSDGAVVVFSGVEGVEAQSEKVWRQSERYRVPKIAFVNKLDRLGASFERCCREMKERFPAVTPVAIHYPVGIENSFAGIVDLVTMTMLQFAGEGGAEVTAAAVPAEIMEDVLAARDEMLAAVAELSDEVADLYLAEEEVPAEMLKSEMRRLVIAGSLCPVLAGSAKRNIGIQTLLDAVVDYLPSPEERATFKAKHPKSEEIVNCSIHDSDFAGLIFKVVAGGSADLLYLRTYSGKIAVNDTVLNPRTGERVKVKRLLRLYSQNIEAIDEVGAGDIVGIIGPKNSFTGDTLCSPRRPVLLEEIKFPEPVISMALEPKTTKDKDKLRHCLEMLCREDPTLNLVQDDNTGQMVLSGMGELHLEVNRHRIRDEFGIEARCGKPRVAFRETLQDNCEITGVFDKTVGDRELYTEVEIALEVDYSDEAIRVELELVDDGTVQNSWKSSARDTLIAGLKTGGNMGYPLIYIRGVIKAIRGTAEKTTEGSVAGAVMDAINRAVRRGTKLLEPLMKLDIFAPEECIGEITGYLQVRRAIIHHIGNLHGNKVLHCEVPLAEMFGFSSALPKLSGGRASFSMVPHGYQEISLEEIQAISGAQQ